MNKDFEIEKTVSKSNDMTLKINGFFLHSKYDPKKEALQFIEKNYKPNSLHILFGYGLGYFAEALVDMLSNNEEILVIDPLYDLLHNGTEPEITVIKNIEDDSFKKILRNKIEKFNRRVHLVRSPNYDKILNNVYKEVLEVISEQLKLNRINENTIRFFSEDWQKNYLYNLFHAVGDKSLLELKGKYDIPVVIASGGPSLTKQLGLLNQIKKNVVIIAAGSTINTIISNGINPDFVVSIDGLKANYNHFKDLHLKHSTYIYSLTSHYGIRERFEKSAYIFNVQGKSEEKNHFEELTKLNLPVIAGGGSVANFAFSIATYISTGPIALIGQDLAYTDNKTHAENNNHFKVVDEEYKKARGMFFAEGYYNDKVLTDYVFLSMKESFEKLLNLVENDRKIFNCTEGGINLKGFNKLPFKEFCQKYVNDIIEKPRINENIINKEEKRIFLLEKMNNELKFYKRIRKILEDNLKIINENKSKTFFSENTLKKLNKNDNKLKELLKNVSMISIVEPITINIHNNYLPLPKETAKESFNRVYNQNKELYSKLIEALDLTNGYTVELIEKIVKN